MENERKDVLALLDAKQPGTPEWTAFQIERRRRFFGETLVRLPARLAHPAQILDLEHAGARLFEELFGTLLGRDESRAERFM